MLQYRSERHEGKGGAEFAFSLSWNLGCAVSDLPFFAKLYSPGLLVSLVAVSYLEQHGTER